MRIAYSYQSRAGIVLCEQFLEAFLRSACRMQCVYGGSFFSCAIRPYEGIATRQTAIQIPASARNLCNCLAIVPSRRCVMNAVTRKTRAEFDRHKLSSAARIDRDETRSQTQIQGGW